ncbi:hypothetical protein EC991_004254 [Linnemannia zychae]|nr:hypothetical protein EC991_004254 [Linnemannia zychae]
MTEITTNDTHLWSTLWILARLRSLSELELELHQVKCIKAIEEFFPLFAKLTVLKIRGHWYSGANTLFSNSDEVIPWRLKELDIDRIDKSFLPYCPDLEHLTLAFNTSSEYEYADRSEFKATILEQLQGLSKLHTIVIRDLPFDDELGVRHRLSKCEGDDNRWSYITLTEDEQGFRPVFVTLQELFSLS